MRIGYEAYSAESIFSFSDQQLKTQKPNYMIINTYKEIVNNKP